MPRFPDIPVETQQPEVRDLARRTRELSKISRMHQFAATPAAAEMTTSELGYYALTATVVLFVMCNGTTFAASLIRT